MTTRIQHLRDIAASLRRDLNCVDCELREDGDFVPASDEDKQAWDRYIALRSAIAELEDRE